MKIRNCHPKIEDGIDLRLFPQQLKHKLLLLYKQIFRLGATVWTTWNCLRQVSIAGTVVALWGVTGMRDTQWANIIVLIVTIAAIIVMVLGVTWRTSFQVTSFEQTENLQNALHI